MQISASVTLVYNVRIGSEGLVEDNLNSARPKALGCNLPAMHNENFHTFEPILVHFAPLYRKEGTKESWVDSWVGNLWYKPLVSFHCTVGSKLAKNCAGLKNFTKTSNSTRVKYVKKQ